MKKYQPIILLIAVMVIVVGVVTGTTFSILYETAFEQKRDDLIQTAKSQARLMEAAMRHQQAENPETAWEDTLSQIKEAHGKYKGFGETGEFTMARREGDRIVFVLRHRHFDLDSPKPVPFASSLAEPMRRALLGQSGTVVGLDYRGVMVLAAHEPVFILELGIVAKVDLAEVRAPFIRAGTIVAIVSTMIVLAGTGLFFLASTPMVRRLQESRAIQRSEERLRRSVIEAPIPIMIHAEGGEVLMISKRWTALSGYSHSDIPNILDWTEKAYGADKGHMRERISGLYEIEEPVEDEAFVTTASGEQRIWDFRTAPLGRLDDGRRFVISMAVDITERKKAEETLRQKDELLRNFVNHSPSMFSLKDMEGRYLLVSEGFSQRLFRVDEQDIKGKTASDLLPKETAEAAVAHDRRVIEAKTAITEEREIPFGDESHTCLITKFPLFDATGAMTGVGGIVTDITERKQAEDEIKASLAEKEVLLREIHHRVKNNLQVVSSFLLLRAGTETDERTIEALKDSERRVSVMARIHEKLHQSENLSSINARDYLSTIVEDTETSSGPDAKDISFHLDADDITFDVDRAVACGQIISELLSNALKHAFLDGQPGNIEVSLHRRDGGRIELVVADDGKGLPEGFDLQRIRTLGLRLVSSLTEKLGGTIHIYGSGGTRVEITFPEQPS